MVSAREASLLHQMPLNVQVVELLSSNDSTQAESENAGVVALYAALCLMDQAQCHDKARVDLDFGTSVS